MTDIKNDVVNITIDGRAVEAKPGEMVIAAAERSGTYVPRFCYHPRMKPVGVCRMCLVEVAGPRGMALVPSCFIPVAEGQEIVTNSERVKQAQDGVLEFLLVNHPLDCPVCDKGGECPLQDQTLAYGPGESRFVEEKRHWEKPIALSELVLLDRERCIQCSRCTRFADEIAGDPLIEFISRGERTEVNVFPDEPFSSYFSGNTVQICPVGALTAEPYRFKSRPWDLEQVESTCTTCSVGCRVAVQSAQGTLVRYLGIDSDPVNQGWLCDKGRFSFESLNSSDRLSAPMARKGSELIEISWGEAIDDLASNLRESISTYGPESIAVIGGAHLTNEDAYAWSKLAKSIIGTDNVDCQLGDGLPADVVLGLPRAEIADLETAPQIVVLSGDIKEELPVLFLRLRQAVFDCHVPLLEITPHQSGISRYANQVVSYNPGDSAVVVQKLVEQGAIAEGSIIILGRPSIAESENSIVEAVNELLKVTGIKFLSGLRRGNVIGALEAGLTPGYLPGGVKIGTGKGIGWEDLPKKPGYSAQEILEHGADGKIKVLILLGADPIADFPDRSLAIAALAKIPNVVAIDTLANETVRGSTLVLPAAGFAEKAGTTTNIEGRVTQLSVKRNAPGLGWSEWAIANEVAFKMRNELRLDSLTAIRAEMIASSESFKGITTASLKASPDGVLIDTSGDPRYIYEPTSSKLTAAPRFDQYSLRLISSRTLYDMGTQVQFSPSLERLAYPAVLKINPADLSHVGVESGSQVKVCRGDKSAVVVAESDPGIPKGCAWLPYSASIGEFHTNDFLSIASSANDIQVESL